MWVDIPVKLVSVADAQYVLGPLPFAFGLERGGSRLVPDGWTSRREGFAVVETDLVTLDTTLIYEITWF
jgi:hypothetical protein